VVLAGVVVTSFGLGVAVASGGGARPHVAGRWGLGGRRPLDRGNGILVLPLSGTVTASGARRDGAASVSAFDAGGGATSGAAVKSVAASAPTSGPVDVAPSSPASLQRLLALTSPDGVQVTVFDRPEQAVGPSAGPAAEGAAPPQTMPGSPAVSGCVTTSQLTLEVSDTAAVGTFSEPLFDGADGALVDVQIGEIGSAEGSPATWVLAQVGAGAATVEVQFADGTVDQAAVPASDVVALAHRGTPTSVLGSGPAAALDVLAADGHVLAAYGLGVDTSAPAASAAPTTLPAPGPTQPADPAGAAGAVTQAVETALGCRVSPLERSQSVAGGGALEVLGEPPGAAVVHVDRVVFTSATAAVVQYDLHSGQGTPDGGARYCAASLSAGAWLLSLASVASGIQVTPADQVGDVTVAPGGPQFVQRWPGGSAVAVYSALPGSSSAPGYGAGDAACTASGGVVEEVTTPGAVGVLTAPRFPGYATPLIGAAVSSVGTAEGSPATVVGVEVGPQVATLAVTGRAATVDERPVHGEAVVVLAGDPSTVLGAAGSQLQVSDASGAVLGTVPLQVDTAAPSGPSSLPTALPPPGPSPADPRAATAEIDQAFADVFDCGTPPMGRVEQVQDGSLLEGALEQLDTGPYEALASSSYLEVGDVVFESPTVADVAYTLRFHSDARLTFSMIGQAVVVAGAWRVSYATVCAAIALGLGTCQT